MYITAEINRATRHFICRSRIWFLVAAALFAAACAPVRETILHEPEKAVRRVRFFFPTFQDDLPTESLATAVERNISYLDTLPSQHIFKYGEESFSPLHIKESQQLLLQLVNKHRDPAKLKKEIFKCFKVFKVSGRNRTEKVLFTGYYEPMYEASISQDETFKYPIYSPPEDMVRVDLGLFHPRFKGDHLVARIDGSRILPYFSRSQIEAGQALEDRGIEIAWLKDPVDVAFLHIQGSGRLKLPDGRVLSAGYAAKNGHPYRSIGAYLIEQGKLTPEGMSMQAIRGYLAANPEQTDAVLNHNPSYVFFRIHEGPAVGNIGVPLTPERSIALDSNLFPKGALCFISTQKPRLDPEGRIADWESFSAFVVNQDTGSAIKGAGRADIFWGSGNYAETAAGHMKHEGEMYLLVKK
jgi:membrane-bound lytic murein transglycosylase A